MRRGVHPDCAAKVHFKLIEHINTLQDALRAFLVPAGATPQELNDEGWSAMHAHSDIRELW